MKETYYRGLCITEMDIDERNNWQEIDRKEFQVFLAYIPESAYKEAKNFFGTTSTHYFKGQVVELIASTNIVDDICPCRYFVRFSCGKTL